MTLSRKLTIIALCALCAIALCVAIGLMNFGKAPSAAAEATDVSKYYYNQLTDEQKEFYTAMEEMESKGIFKKSGDYDLVESGHVSQAQLDAYANGSTAILDTLGAARDAYYADNADVFYVDFSYLSLRVTLDGNNTYHAWLGNGRADTYYVEGFTSEAEVSNAVTAYNVKLSSVVEDVKKAKPNDDDVKALGQDKANVVAQIRAAHTWIAENNVYKLEKDAAKGNAGHVRTTYGGIITGEVLCEGYSRTFKTIMDKIGVPCVLVQGVYRHTQTQLELHMWVYVEVDGEWFAVDQTFDDLNPAPLPSAVVKAETDEKATETDGDQKYRSTYREFSEEYFLVGKTVMNAQHTPSNTFSDCGYEFTQPELSEYSIYAAVSTQHGMIYVVQTPGDVKHATTDIYVSVLIEGKWYGLYEAAQRGYYVLQRHEGYYLPEQLMGSGAMPDLTTADESDIKYADDQVWGYLYLYDPTGNQLEVYGNVEEGEGYTIIKGVTKSTGFEFAVTNIAPRKYEAELAETYTYDQILEMTTYCGDTTMFVARSGLIETKYNGFEDYHPAPHILRASPTASSKMDVGPTYNVKIEYDQWLELKTEYDEQGNIISQDTQIKASVYGMRATGEILKGTNAVPISVISELNWNPGKIGTTEFGYITFKFTPSKYFAHDDIMYMFNFNLQGVNSHKPVNAVSYVAANVPGRCSAGRPGYNWHVFGQPSLMENSDLSLQGWELADGTDVSEMEGMKDRLALVVTRPTQQQENEMDDLLKKEDDLPDEFESFTYNIALTLCKCMVIKTGEKVRVSIGFPEGFTYDSTLEGVTFKAYHFMRDKQNHVIGVEELECTVTKFGLIIMCDSFSPFAIVAVKGEAPAADAKKTVIISNTAGGTAYAGGENLFTLKEGDERPITIKANDGYVIESVKINGQTEKITDASAMTLTVKYDELSSGQSIVDVQFVSEKIIQAEQARGESVIEQTLTKAKITFDRSVSVAPGAKLVLNPQIIEYGEKNYYQWYKDGRPLVGETNKTLTVNSAKASNSGRYTLVVTSVSGSLTAVSESNIITVSVETQSSSGDTTETPDDNTDDKPTVNTPTGGSTEAESDNTWLWILLGVLLGLIVIAVVVLVIIKSKKHLR